MSENTPTSKPSFNLPSTREGLVRRHALIVDQVEHMRARLFRQMVRGEAQALSRRIKVNTQALGDMQQELLAIEAVFAR